MSRIKPELIAMIKMPYLPDFGLYIGKYHIWTEEEFEDLWDIVKEYHYRHPSEGELLSIFFPQVKEEKKRGITEADIQKAKDVPIDTLLTIKRHLTLCLYHSEKNPSAYWYESNNKLYCFSCGVSADSIDVVQKLNGLSFNGAVSYLNERR